MAATSGKRRRWSAAEVPTLKGRTAVVTGANSGIGFEATRVLAARGATTVLACRNPVKAREARDRVLAESPDADIHLLELDLNSLASVRKAAETLLVERPTIDILINNAGVIMLPHGRTEDGFEQHFGVNHLAHFAFTGLVLPAVLAADAGRIITVGSNGHRMGKIDFEDIPFERGYKPLRGYARSKLANLLFSYELHRRLAAAHAPAISLAAHPGGATTNAGGVGGSQKLRSRLFNSVPNPIAHSPQMGALPMLRAAVDPQAVGGQYYGPRGLLTMTGPPVIVKSNARSQDTEAAARLWTLSTELTGITYPL